MYLNVPNKELIRCREEVCKVCFCHLVIFSKEFFLVSTSIPSGAQNLRGFLYQLEKINPLAWYSIPSIAFQEMAVAHDISHLGGI